MAIDLDFKAARAQGIDINQVGESLAHYLSEARQRVRDNPQLLQPEPEGAINVAIHERKLNDGRVRWETLGTLPCDVAPVTVYATRQDAALNGCALRQLLDRRYRREFAMGLLKASVYPDTLEGRRAALKRAIGASLHVADTAA